jgi:hypothetical protein
MTLQRVVTGHYFSRFELYALFCFADLLLCVSSLAVDCCPCVASGMLGLLLGAPLLMKTGWPWSWTVPVVWMARSMASATLNAHLSVHRSSKPVNLHHVDERVARGLCPMACSWHPLNCCVLLCTPVSGRGLQDHRQRTSKWWQTSIQLYDIRQCWSCQSTVTTRL